MSTPSYGFIVALRTDGDMRPVGPERHSAPYTFRASVDGATWVVRHYAATPESCHEWHPLVSDRTVLVYEGRVDNRQLIADALGRPDLAHASDGAVLLAAFEAWGPSLVAKVIGEYAFAALDRQTRRLAAGQDALGVRRVFYRASDERLWLTSNLRLLFEEDRTARPDIDREVLSEYFAGTMVPWTGRTLWRGVREVARGRVLVVVGKNIREQPVWQPRPDPRLRTANAAEVDETFRALLFQGVRGALRAPGHVLCDLSGGLDSSTLCSVAARLTRDLRPGQSVVAWSTFNTASNDDALQRTVAEHCGFDRCGLDIGRHLPFAAFRDAELPSGGVIQCEAADRVMREFAHSRGISTRISGHGADVLLQKGRPAPVYLSEWVRERRLRPWARDVKTYAAGGAFSLWHLFRDCSVGTLDMHAGTFRRPLPSWLRPAFRKEVADAQRDFLRPASRSFGSDARERVYRATLAFIPHHGQMLPDERLPLLHRPLVEFILGLGWEHLVRPNEDRVLMRRALAGILPPAARTASADSRHGASLIEGLRAAWPRASTLLTGQRLADLGVVEAQGFRAAIDAMRAGYAGPNMQCTHTALYLEAWLSLKARPSSVTAAADVPAGRTSVGTEWPMMQPASDTRG